MLPSLYELEQQYLDLLKWDAESDEDTDAWNELLESLTGDIENKVTNCALVVQELKSDVAGIADEIRRLQDRKKAAVNKIDSLKSYMQQGMELAGIEKTKDVRVTVSIQNNPPALLVYDEDMVPADYIRIVEEIDKAKIKDAIKAGDDVPGARLTQGRGIRIR